MNTRSYFYFLFLLIYSGAASQSFEKISLLDINMLPYPFNESNAYVTTDGNRMFFNSSDNINNSSGLSDMNDVWIRNKINGVWGSPINLTEINTIEDELILGLGESDLEKGII